MRRTAAIATWLSAAAAPLWAQTPLPPTVTSTAADSNAAVERARSAADAAIAARGADSVAAADALEALAVAYAQAGRSPEAAPVLRRVLPIREKAGNAEALAVTLNRLSIVLEDARETEALARRAIAVATPLTANRQPLAVAYANLGQSLAQQRRYGEADAAFRQALEVTRAAAGEASPSTAIRMMQVAQNLVRMGRPADAEPVYRRALPILSASGAADSADVALGYDMLARTLYAQDKFAEAEPVARQSVALYQRRYGPDAQGTLNAQETLSNILIQQRKLPEAEAIARILTTKRSEAKGTPFVDLVADQGRLGQVLAMQGKLREAEPYFARAVELARGKLGSGDPLLAYGLLSLAGVRVQLDPKDPGAVGTARELLRLSRSERARATAAKRASPAQQALSRAMGGNPAAGDLAAQAAAFWMLVTELRILQFPSEREAMRRESFTAAQELAQSAAGRAMAQTAARQAAGQGPLADLVRRQQDLADQARKQSDALVAALGQGPEAETRLGAENERIGTELAAVDAELRRRFPAYARMIAPAPLSEDEARRRLRPGEGLLLIVPVDDALFLYALSRDKAVRVTSPLKVKEMQALSSRLRCNIDPLTCPGKPGEATMAYEGDAALKLYQGLVAPAEPALGGVKTLYVNTAGALADIPFAALLTAPAPADESLTKAAWLGDRYALVALPSVSSLHAGRDTARRTAPDDRFIGYGAPVLAPAGDSRGTAPAKVAATALKEGGLVDPAVVRTMSSLPGTAVELKAMAQALAAPAATVHLGPQATEAAVRADPRLAEARVVAFATHGLLPGDLDGLRQPGLVFTPPVKASPQDDGVLQASEAAGLRLAAEWVILSACNTASPEGEGRSDSLSALARAFLYAGADSLLASHWRIGDEVTAALTVETLANARANPNAGHAAALQAAMQAVRTGRRADGTAIVGWKEDWSHPAAWAPFSLIAHGG